VEVFWGSPYEIWGPQQSGPISNVLTAIIGRKSVNYEKEAVIKLVTC